MDIFLQKKFLIRLVILLAVLNLFSIGIFIRKDFFCNRPSKELKNHHDISAVLEKKLNLSETQTVQLKNLRNLYFEKEEVLVKVIRLQRDSMNQAMFNKDNNEELVKTIAARVAANEYQMELLRFEQAKEFKSICSPQQLEKFNSLIKEIRDYFRPDNQSKEKK